MNEKLQQRADAAIAAYRDEIEDWPEWSAVPIRTIRSRERLTSLIALGAPEFVVKNEIAMLRERISEMKLARQVRAARGSMLH